MLDSVRSSITAATFRVNDRPHAKPNPNHAGKTLEGTVFLRRVFLAVGPRETDTFRGL